MWCNEVGERSLPALRGAQQGSPDLEPWMTFAISAKHSVKLCFFYPGQLRAASNVMTELA
jgi:hypothetical protein